MFASGCCRECGQRAQQLVLAVPCMLQSARAASMQLHASCTRMQLLACCTQRAAAGKLAAARPPLPAPAAGAHLLPGDVVVSLSSSPLPPVARVTTSARRQPVERGARRDGRQVSGGAPEARARAARVAASPAPIAAAGPPLAHCPPQSLCRCARSLAPFWHWGAAPMELWASVSGRGATCVWRGGRQR